MPFIFKKRLPNSEKSFSFIIDNALAIKSKFSFILYFLGFEVQT